MRDIFLAEQPPDTYVEWFTRINRNTMSTSDKLKIDFKSLYNDLLSALFKSRDPRVHNNLLKNQYSFFDKYIKILKNKDLSDPRVRGVLRQLLVETEMNSNHAADVSNNFNVELAEKLKKYLDVSNIDVETNSAKMQNNIITDTNADIQNSIEMSNKNTVKLNYKPNNSVYTNTSNPGQLHEVQNPNAIQTLSTHSNFGRNYSSMNYKPKEPAYKCPSYVTYNYDNNQNSNKSTSPDLNDYNCNHSSSSYPYKPTVHSESMHLKQRIKNRDRSYRPDRERNTHGWHDRYSNYMRKYEFKQKSNLDKSILGEQTKNGNRFELNSDETYLETYINTRKPITLLNSIFDKLSVEKAETDSQITENPDEITIKTINNEIVTLHNVSEITEYLQNENKILTEQMSLSVNNSKRKHKIVVKKKKKIQPFKKEYIQIMPYLLAYKYFTRKQVNVLNLCKKYKYHIEMKMIDIKFLTYYVSQDRLFFNYCKQFNLVIQLKKVLTIKKTNPPPIKNTILCVWNKYPKRPNALRLNQTRFHQIKSDQTQLNTIRSNQARLNTRRPNQTRLDTIRPNPTKSNQTRLNTMRSNQTRPNAIRSNQTRLNTLRPIQTRLTPTRSNQTRSNTIRSNQTRSNTIRSNQTRLNTIGSSQRRLHLRRSRTDSTRHNQERPIPISREHLIRFLGRVAFTRSRNTFISVPQRVGQDVRSRRLELRKNEGLEYIGMTRLRFGGVLRFYRRRKNRRSRRRGGCRPINRQPPRQKKKKLALKIENIKIETTIDLCSDSEDDNKDVQVLTSTIQQNIIHLCAGSVRVQKTVDETRMITDVSAAPLCFEDLTVEPENQTLSVPLGQPFMGHYSSNKPMDTIAPTHMPCYRNQKRVNNTYENNIHGCPIKRRRYNNMNVINRNPHVGPPMNPPNHYTNLMHPPAPRQPFKPFKKQNHIKINSVPNLRNHSDRTVGTQRINGSMVSSTSNLQNTAKINDIPHIDLTVENSDNVETYRSPGIHYGSHSDVGDKENQQSNTFPEKKPAKTIQNKTNPSAAQFGVVGEPLIQSFAQMGGASHVAASDSSAVSDYSIQPQSVDGYNYQPPNVDNAIGQSPVHPPYFPPPNYQIPPPNYYQDNFINDLQERHPASSSGFGPPSFEGGLDINAPSYFNDFQFGNAVHPPNIGFDTTTTSGGHFPYAQNFGHIPNQYGPPPYFNGYEQHKQFPNQYGGPPANGYSVLNGGYFDVGNDHNKKEEYPGLAGFGKKISKLINDFIETDKDKKGDFHNKKKVKQDSLFGALSNFGDKKKYNYKKIFGFGHG